MTREMFNKMKEKRERIDVIFFVLVFGCPDYKKG